MDRAEFTIPRPRITLVSAADNYGRFAVEPLDRGHALPLGNALRRVLLSSVPGAAITRIKVTGLMHEFATIPGVVEDGTRLVLHVKGIRLRCYAERPVTMHLTKRGIGPVRAGDIEAPSTVEIVNPEHYLCTLDDDTVTFEMQLTAERGRGAILADSISGLNIGEIAVDGIFSPVPKVNFVVEPAGPGLERLLMEIWTDGTAKPGDALSHAAQVLAQYLGRVAVLGEPDAAEELPDAGGRLIPAEIADRPIDELGLTTRTFNCLRRAGINNVGQLLAMDERALLSVRNLGPKGVDEIRQRLAALGYGGSDDAPPALDEPPPPAEDSNPLLN
jgi:DNA-directed RNA polymerase subunit alpha